MLSQVANVEVVLGEYSEAETRSRAALDALASDEKAYTSSFAMAESILADADYREVKELAAQGTLGKEKMGPLDPRLGILLTSLGHVSRVARYGRSKAHCQTLSGGN